MAGEKISHSARAHKLARWTDFHNSNCDGLNAFSGKIIVGGATDDYQRSVD